MMMQMMVEVNNVEAYAEKYPFAVARVSDAELWFWGAYSTETDARQAAEEVGGIVLRTK